MYRFIFKLFRPFTWLISKINNPFIKDSISLNKMSRSPVIGDVFLTHKRGQLSNLFIPAKLDHGAIYVGEYLLLEAVMGGIRLIDLRDFLSDKSYCEVKRFPLTKRNKIDIKHGCRQFLNKKYDNDFMFGNDKFYCFEVVGKLLKVALPDLKLKEFTTILGNKIYDSRTFTTDDRFELIQSMEAENVFYRSEIRKKSTG